MKKSEKKKIAVGVCGTVFRSFLIFTVISCLPFYGSLSNLRAVSLAHLRFRHVYVCNSYRKKKIEKKKKSK